MSEEEEIDLRNIFPCKNCGKSLDINEIMVDARILLPNVSIKCPKCKVYFHFMVLIIAEDEFD